MTLKCVFIIICELCVFVYESDLMHSSTGLIYMRKGHNNIMRVRI